MKEYNKTRYRIIFILAAAVLIVIDQITKKVVLNTLVDNTISLIDNVLEFHYLENRGAAFGIMQNNIPFFAGIGIIVALIVAYIFIKLPANRHYLSIDISLLLLFSGAIGNLIDRVFRHYVVDFIYFKLINFPIFNVADIYVTIGAILLIVVILFVYKDGDFKMLFKKK